ncbi:MFS transporter [Candidatus Nomurabacteria bacterium]|nr:MFS transporter [Candidatus Nomurabacteria bacterium]
MSNSLSINKSIVYVLVFLFTLHITPATYVNSSFLGEFVQESSIGIVFSIASIVTIIGFFYIRKVLRKIGNYKTTILMIFLELATLLLMAFVDVGSVVIIAYIIGFTCRSLIYFNLDVFLENMTSNESTGGIRGIFLTSLNMAFLIGPFIASLVMKDHDFWKIYLISSFLLLPVLYILIRYLRRFEDSTYEHVDIFKTAKRVYDHCNFYGIFVSAFLLRFFYSWMVIYTPIYLNQHIGFSLSETTMIIGIALIPFVLLEALLGWLADKKVGEKEILTAGFIITAGATAIMSFVSLPNIILWSAILFTTRIGASMIEVMTETYLFKKIDSEDIDVLSLFRMVRPVAYIFGPLLASFLLTFIDFKYLFLILGSIVLYGIRYSLAIRDTR